MLETKLYRDGTSATGTAPLPDRSPRDQDIYDGLIAARKYAEWPGGCAKELERILAVIDRTIALVS